MSREETDELMTSFSSAKQILVINNFNFQTIIFRQLQLYQAVKQKCLSLRNITLTTST